MNELNELSTKISKQVEVSQAEIDKARAETKTGVKDWNNRFVLGVELSPELLAEAELRKLDFMRRHGLIHEFRETDWSHPRAQAYREKLRRLKEDEPEEEFSEAALKRKFVAIADSEARKTGRERFEWDWGQSTEKMKKAIANLFLYFCNDPRGELALNKGVCLTGPTGTGKTMIMRIFQRFAVEVIPHSGNRFNMKTCRDIYKDFSFGQHEQIEKYTKGNWCFDDLGQEELIYKHYGNEVCVMEQVLFYRNIELEKGNRIKTLLTTNLDPLQIEERYQSRIADRLKQMVSFVGVEGESKRK